MARDQSTVNTNDMWGRKKKKKERKNRNSHWFNTKKVLTCKMKSTLEDRRQSCMPRAEMANCFRNQILASNPSRIGFGTVLSLTSLSLASNSHALGGTSTAGEQLKNPCGCSPKTKKKIKNRTRHPKSLTEKMKHFQNKRVWYATTFSC